MSILIFVSILVLIGYLILCFGITALIYIFSDIIYIGIYLGKIFSWILSKVTKTTSSANTISLVITVVIIFVYVMSITVLYLKNKKIFLLYSTIWSLEGTLSLIKEFNFKIDTFKYEPVNTIALIMVVIVMTIISLVIREKQFSYISKHIEDY